MTLYQQFSSHESIQIFPLHYSTQDGFLGEQVHFLIVIIWPPLDQEKARHSLEKLYHHYTQMTNVHYFWCS